jgi:anti-sigma B factor antagonist
VFDLYPNCGLRIPTCNWMENKEDKGKLQMALNFEEREREGILILGLSGRLTMGSEDAAFQDRANLSIGAGKIKIVVDCGRLETIDSVGLGTLVSYQLKLRRAGGNLVLLRLARTHMELLVLAKLDAVFDVFDDEQEAVNSFFPERAVRRFDILDFVENQTRKPQSPGENPTGSRAR